MGGSPARAPSTARVAVVGAASPSGAHVRQALEARGVSGSRVDLFGVTGGEAVLSEYAGEARLVQELDAEEVARHEVIFLCERGDAVRRIIALAGSGSLVIDLERGAAQDAPAPLVHVDIRPLEAKPLRSGVLAVPHPLAVVLAELLYPLDRHIGLHRVTGFVMRPAADFGDIGLEELQGQTLGLLRFAPPPTEVFGRQLAFNLIPQRLLDAFEEGLERRLAGEVARLLTWSETRLALRLVTVPVFHGHALSIRFEPSAPVGVTDVVDVLGSGHAVRVDRDRCTPIEAGDQRTTIVTEVTEDGLGGFWIWAVAAEVGRAAAEQAVRLAGEAGGL